MYYRVVVVFLILLFSCKPKENFINQPITQIDDAHNVIHEVSETPIADTTFVNLKNFSNTIKYDIRYATDNNFLKQKVYECSDCFLRYKTVKLLIKANEEFNKLGYSLKLFDCYRPVSVQEKMWRIMPNPDYVANPKNGSMHNRGCAVDITLVDSVGNEINMGTEFDFFGIEASHSYKNFSQEIISNRNLLKTIMEKHQFEALNSEWWHYSVIGEKKQKNSNFKWKCD